MSKSVFRFGFWFAFVSFLAAAGYSIVQILQLLRLISWPWDAITIFGFSLCIATPFMLAMLALHQLTPPEKRVWSGAGVLFSVMYATYASLMYVVQLATALPLALKGAPNPLFDVSRYSFFWALDAMAYIAMGLAMLIAAPAFAASEKWAKRFFLINGLFTGVIATIYFYPRFSIPLLLVGAPWVITGPGAILMLALTFRRRSADLAAAGADRQGNLLKQG